jgi:NAD(P)-dependent dehydrogenase (short-subunit alcohol dehydrogenase family)
MSGGTTQAGPVSLASLPVGYRALVVGARGGIGAAFVQALQADPRCAAVVGLHRGSSPALDLADEASVAAAAAALAPARRRPAAWPPRHARKAPGPVELRADGSHLPHQHLRPRAGAGPLCTAAAQAGRGLLAVLSAKVGSIGDNRLGGWYSYRASKAALNMLVKTASIEVARTHPQAVLVALHPGTVNSALSACQWSSRPCTACASAARRRRGAGLHREAAQRLAPVVGQHCTACARFSEP